MPSHTELKLDLRDPLAAAKILKHSSSKGELAKLVVQYLTMANRLARLLDRFGKEENWVVKGNGDGLDLIWNGEGKETPPEIIPKVLKELGWQSGGGAVSGNRTNNQDANAKMKEYEESHGPRTPEKNDQ